MDIQHLQVCAIVVLYKPDKNVLLKVIDKVSSQVDKIVLVDNTPEGPHECFDIKQVLNPGCKMIEYLPLRENTGIANAQNVGIKQVSSLSEFLIFFDQDSFPEENLVEQLIATYKKLDEMGFQIGGVGPRVVNRENRQKELPVFNKGQKINSSVTKVTQLMSSGTLSPSKVLKKVGGFENDLFIDAVEFEWCWRAAERGYSFFITEDAQLFHRTGESTKKILGKPLHITTPFRTYYQYRNFLILLKRKYVPFYWKFSNLIKYTFKFFYYPLFVAPRSQYFRRMTKGICAGVHYWITGKIV
jgi:rhamnosyltransferase